MRKNLSSKLLDECFNIPTFNPNNCEFCLGCVHLCLKKAIIYSKSIKDRSRLDEKFYKRAKLMTFNRLRS
ncbi:MAG: hypothetical protein ACFFAS_20585 [Promethearchaeota archaeon]